jgi:putative hemolysin
MHHLEHIPQAGESFQWDDLRIEVVDMDGKRVDKLLVSRQAARASQEAPE